MIHLRVYVSNKPSREEGRPVKLSTKSCAEQKMTCWPVTDMICPIKLTRIVSAFHSNNVCSYFMTWLPPPPLSFCSYFLIISHLSVEKHQDKQWQQLHHLHSRFPPLVSVLNAAMWVNYLLIKPSNIIKNITTTNYILTRSRVRPIFHRNHRTSATGLCPSFFSHTINRKECGFGYM